MICMSSYRSPAAASQASMSSITQGMIWVQFSVYRLNCRSSAFSRNDTPTQDGGELRRATQELSCSRSGVRRTSPCAYPPPHRASEVRPRATCSSRGIQVRPKEAQQSHVVAGRNRLLLPYPQSNEDRRVLSRRDGNLVR